MSKSKKKSINDLLLEAHARGVLSAIELSIRTGVPLASTNKKGEIIEVKPKFKYVLVPIKPKKRKNLLRKK